MNFIDIIRRNLDGNALRTIIHEFTNNVIRSTDRTVEPVLTDKETSESDAAKTGIQSRSNRQLIFDDVMKGRAVETEPEISVSEVAEFFESLSKRNEDLLANGNLACDQSTNTMQQAAFLQEHLCYVGPNTDRLQQVDPIYYMESMQRKILLFELELSGSKCDIEERRQQLNENYRVIVDTERAIVSQNGRLLTHSLAGVTGVDEQVQATLSKIKSFRKSRMQSWQTYNKKAELIKTLAQKRKKLESKLNFLKGFRRNTARVITSPFASDSSNWQNVVKAVELALSNLKRLNSDQEMLISSRISCLRTLRECCNTRLASAAKWSINQFMKYLSSTTSQLNPASFIAVWLYLQPYDPQVCSKGILTVGRCLEQEFVQKIACNQLNDGPKLIRSVFEPIVRIMGRLIELQNRIKKQEAGDFCLGETTIQSYKKQCLHLNESCFEPSKQKLISQVLTMLSTKLPLADRTVGQYIQTALLPMVQLNSQSAETKTALERFQQQLRQ